MLVDPCPSDWVMSACDFHFFWLWLINSHSPGKPHFSWDSFEAIKSYVFFIFPSFVTVLCTQNSKLLWIQQSPRLGIDQGEYFHSSILKTLVSTQLLLHRLPIISALFLLNEIKIALIDEDYWKQNSSFCLENWVNPIPGFITPTWRLLYASLMEPLHIRECK